ncbi:alpha/beta hydrolase [Ornithinibacillus salinisoli]|uniref:Alpha/beta hydrolase n=1 Tax=Ornithinibacillus salinisoli TaxID=1848459 RepID=A0ABW4VX30_9BACI
MVEKYSVLENAEEFYFPGNEIGVLVSHGFTGTTQSMYDIGKQIAERGFTVYGPRLTGHGTHQEDMERASYQDWIGNVEAGVEKLKETCSSLFVVGLSMGGTLSLYLAENDPEIAGIMPINAATNLPEMESYYHEIKDGEERFVDGIGSDIKKDGVEELAYPKTPVKSMGDLLALMNMVRKDLEKITVPTLIFSSTIDHVVPPDNSLEIYQNISSDDKSIVILENSYHVATLDNDKDMIAKKCISFIRKHTK